MVHCGMPLHLFPAYFARFYVSIPQLPLALTLECRILLVASGRRCRWRVMKILPLANAYFFTLIAIRVSAASKSLEYCQKICKRLRTHFARDGFFNGILNCPVNLLIFAAIEVLFCAICLVCNQICRYKFPLKIYSEIDMLFRTQQRINLCS